MAKYKDLEVWLSCLQNTENFESVFRHVFERVMHGKGYGLLILKGPSKEANKSYFLNMVKAFQDGVPLKAKQYFSDDLQRLLGEVDVSQYQCVDIKEDCPMDNVLGVPLYLTLPFSLASASQKRGLKKAHKIIVLCDDLQEFLGNNEKEQMLFLGQIANFTNSYKEITFLGAYTPAYPKYNLDDTALSKYSLALGPVYD